MVRHGRICSASRSPSTSSSPITIAGWILLNRTRYGRYVVAVGGNREAARIAGVPVRKVIFSVYVLSGLLAGIATILLCARLGSASPVSGNLYELDAIGAVVIGGTSLAGGRATIVGTFLGVLTFALIFSLMTQLNLSTEVQQVTKGSDRARRGPAADGRRPGTRCRVHPQRGGDHTMSLKRLITSIAAAALLTFVVAACGGDDEDQTERRVTSRPRAPADRRPSTEASGKTVSIIASVPPTDHGWLGAISKNAKAAAEQHDDVEFELLEAADADSQAQQIEQAIAQKPDALVVLPAGRRGADAGRPEGRGRRHPGRSTSTACSPSPTRPPRRSSATTTRSACSRPSTSPSSSSARATSSRSRASPASRSPRTARKGFNDELKKRCPDGGLKIVASAAG